MRKLTLSKGLRWALLLFFVNAFLAVTSYVFGCILTASTTCNVTRGLEWIYQHPVFPQMISAMTIFGFVCGALTGLIPERLKTLLLQLLPWAVIALLAAAFLLWGLPDIGFLLEEYRAARS